MPNIPATPSRPTPRRKTPNLATAAAVAPLQPRFIARHPLLFATCIGVIIISGSWLGAIGKEYYQARTERQLRALENGGILSVPNTVKSADKVANERQIEGRNELRSAQKEYNKEREQIYLGQEHIDAQQQRVEKERQKKIIEQIENLEVRKKEMLAQRAGIVAKVVKLRDRMRRREEQQAREGGTGGGMKTNDGG